MVLLSIFQRFQHFILYCSKQNITDTELWRGLAWKWNKLAYSKVKTNENLAQSAKCHSHDSVYLIWKKLNRGSVRETFKANAKEKNQRPHQLINDRIHDWTNNNGKNTNKRIIRKNGVNNGAERGQRRRRTYQRKITKNWKKVEKKEKHIKGRCF
jgi:hypothetical protein